jgi:hypothetical protein
MASRMLAVAADVIDDRLRVGVVPGGADRVGAGHGRLDRRRVERVGGDRL